MSHRFRLPSPAMVVACLALLVATAGVGTAATIIVTGQNVRNGTLTGADVQNRSLGTVEFTTGAIATLRGRRGAAGRAGVPGPPGPAGPSETFAAVRTTISPPPLTAGTTTTIATRTLGIGKYVILARLGLDDVSGSPKNVTCRLDADGVSDQVAVGVPGVAAGGSTDCTLMLAVDLTAPGNALLRITTPAGSSIRARDAKVIAIKVGFLDINNVTG
jgi:hypothetical protein